MEFVASLVANFADPILAIVTLLIMWSTKKWHIAVRFFFSAIAGTASHMAVMSAMAVTGLPKFMMPMSILACAVWCAVYLAVAKLLRKRQA